MNAQQITELRRDEGSRLTVYDDATGQSLRQGDSIRGHPTIGIGRALDVNGISLTEAEYLLANDIERIERELGQTNWFKALDPVRQGVMVNLAFNMGVAGLKTFVRMIAACQAKDFDEAVRQLKDSHWYRQAPIARSSRLIRQLQTGVL